MVQLAPFIYLIFLSAYLLGESFMPGWAVRLADNLVSAPVYVTLGMLVAGRVLKLCDWFRTACVIPFTTRVESYVDSFIYTFTQNEIVIVNAVTGILFILFVLVSFRHFFYGRIQE